MTSRRIVGLLIVTLTSGVSANAEIPTAGPASFKHLSELWAHHKREHKPNLHG